MGEVEEMLKTDQILTPSFGALMGLLSSQHRKGGETLESINAMLEMMLEKDLSASMRVQIRKMLGG